MQRILGAYKRSTCWEDWARRKEQCWGSSFWSISQMGEAPMALTSRADGRPWTPGLMDGPEMQDWWIALDPKDVYPTQAESTQLSSSASPPNPNPSLPCHLRLSDVRECMCPISTPTSILITQDTFLPLPLSIQGNSYPTERESSLETWIKPQSREQENLTQRKCIWNWEQKLSTPWVLDKSLQCSGGMVKGARWTLNSLSSLCQQPQPGGGSPWLCKALAQPAFSEPNSLHPPLLSPISIPLPQSEAAPSLESYSQDLSVQASLQDSPWGSLHSCLGHGLQPLRTEFSVMLLGHPFPCMSHCSCSLPS